MVPGLDSHTDVCLGDEESPFLDFLWHLGPALHIFSGKLCISLGNLVMSLLTQRNGSIIDL